MKYILCDTCFLVSCAEYKIDFFEQLRKILDFNFEILIIDKVMMELNKIMAKSTKEGQAAKLAKTILMTKRVIIQPAEGKNVDSILLKKADDHHIVATQDKELKQKLRKKKQPVIFIRQKKKLQIVGL